MTDWDDPFLDAMEPLLARFRDSEARRESLRMHKALVLAPDLETFEALLRQEAVPLERLDPKGLRALGLR